MAKSPIKTKRLKDKLIVELIDPLNVQHIRKTFNSLKRIEYNKPTIEFWLQNKAHFDLAFIQVLVALKKTHLNKEQKITLKGTLNESQKTVILNSLSDINIAT